MRSNVGIPLAVAALALTLITTGCGGGGGGSKVPANPVAAVQARQTSLGNAIERKDVNAIMRYYSVTWTNATGDTVDDLRATYEQGLPLLDFVDAQGEPSYLVSDDGTEVATGGNAVLRFRVKATGEIITIAGSAGDVWRKLGENWYLVYSESNMSIQQALRHLQQPKP